MPLAQFDRSAVTEFYRERLLNSEWIAGDFPVIMSRRRLPVEIQHRQPRLLLLAVLLHRCFEARDTLALVFIVEHSGSLPANSLPTAEAEDVTAPIEYQVP